MDDLTGKIAVSATEQLAREAYADVIHPVAEPTGAVLGLVPRAIRAALSPIEEWIIVREHNLTQVKKMLDEKLASTPVDDIETPEPYVGVPALQAASYCVDNDDLRDMYANLLASSMKRQTKPLVHPGYVQIIQQLLPDEAKILKAMMLFPGNIPVIDLHIKTAGESGYKVRLQCFNPFVYECGCEHPENFLSYFNNLTRLGLMEHPSWIHIANDRVYEELFNHPFVKHVREPFEQSDARQSIDPHKGLIQLTDFGRAFCNICVSD